MALGKKPGRPRIYGKREKITVHLSPALLRRLEKRAKGKRWSLSATAVELLTKGLKS